MGVMKSLWIFPVSIAILLPCTFILTYFLAIWFGHAQPLVPFISDTGALPPESCVFAQMLNIIVVLTGIVVYLRHRQVVEFYRHSKESKKWFLRIRSVFLWVGFFSAFGISMVGNFQEINWGSAHKFGAGCAFLLGLVYCWAQTIFTYRMQPVLHWPWVGHLRLALALLATSCLLIMEGLLLTGQTPKRMNRALIGCAPSGEASLAFVKPGSKGYDLYLAQTICEWLLSFAYVGFFITYAIELRHAVLKSPKLILHVNCDRLPHDPGFKCTSILEQGKTESPKTTPESTESAALKTAENPSKSSISIKKQSITSPAVSVKSQSQMQVKTSKSGISIKKQSITSPAVSVKSQSQMQVKNESVKIGG